MKLKGKQIKGPNAVTLVLPREGQDPLIFKAQAVLDYAEFDKLCPKPTPPDKIMKGGQRVPNFEAPAYIQAIEAYGAKRTNWLFIESLRATPDLEWETIKYNDPETWLNFEQELKDAGISDIEKQRILYAITSANCLDERKLDEARATFLLEEAARLETQSSQMDGQKNMQSGKLVNASA